MTWTSKPRGGFQGGVLVASAVVLIYLGYGYNEVSKKFNMEIIKKNEALGAILFTVFGLAGIIYGSVFFANVFTNIGDVGDLISAGTIMFMNNSVGYKVLTGVGFLILLMIGLLAPDNDN
ncbi:MnhB domain-containing protein [Caloramator sp. Dgby_cultured_2]|nr:MnhB domain-containing protein [Caloramator sp. Dgby_cultured_2]WDU84488.1 MnhB domain-containing protein [Caloramator sp. Dgby_cultured_2]